MSCKIFVGGLAWETRRETLKGYFDRFGEILEAVVITDKVTGKSKGYGFVTFGDPGSASRACWDPYPVIDGRRANCNLASLGAQKNRFSTNQQGTEKFRQKFQSAASPSVQPSSEFFPQSVPHGAFTYPAYGLDDLDSIVSSSSDTGMKKCGFNIEGLSRVTHTNNAKSKSFKTGMQKGSEGLKSIGRSLRFGVFRAVFPEDLKSSEKKILDPQDKFLLLWNKLSVASCIMAIYVYPFRVC